MSDQFNQQSTWQDHQFADPPKGHPLTWAQEVEQLQAEKKELAMQVEEACKAQDQAESAASWADIRANQAVEEAKALRARVAELEVALVMIAEYLPLFDYVGSDEFGPRTDRPGSPFDRGREQEAKHLASIARAALQRPTAPHTATHSAKSSS